MKSLTRKPAAITDKAAVIQYETDKLSAIKTHNPTYGTNVFTICQILFQTSGVWYFEIFLLNSAQGFFSPLFNSSIFISNYLKPIVKRINV
jgi:hypothetical protein